MVFITGKREKIMIKKNCMREKNIADEFLCIVLLLQILKHPHVLHCSKREIICNYFTFVDSSFFCLP